MLQRICEAAALFNGMQNNTWYQHCSGRQRNNFTMSTKAHCHKCFLATTMPVCSSQCIVTLLSGGRVLFDGNAESAQETMLTDSPAYSCGWQACFDRSEWSRDPQLPCPTQGISQLSAAMITAWWSLVCKSHRVQMLYCI